MRRAIDENRSHYLQTTGVPRLLELHRREASTSERHPDWVARRGHRHDRRHPRALHPLSGLLEPGDEVIVPDPEWPPSMGNIKLAHGVVVPCPLHERWVALRPRRARVEDHAEDQGDLRQLAAQPHGRRAHAAPISNASPPSPRSTTSGSSRTKPTRTLSSTGRARERGVAAGHVRANDPVLHVQQDLRDDRAAARLRGGAGCGAARSDEEGALLHREQRLLGRAVRRHRRARGIAGVHRGVPDRAAGAARSVL